MANSPRKCCDGRLDAPKNTLVAAACVPADRITVVPNGVDVEQFSPHIEPDEEISSRYDDMPVVEFVGSFQAFHGPQALGQMALRLCERGHLVGFAFVGGGAGLETVRRMTAPISDQVLFAGRVPQERVPRVLRAMDIGILPDTAYYCCPLKLLEWIGGSGSGQCHPDPPSTRRRARLRGNEG